MLATETLQPFHSFLLHRWKLFNVICGQQLLVKKRAAFTGELKKKKGVLRL